MHAMWTPTVIIFEKLHAEKTWFGKLFLLPERGGDNIMSRLVGCADICNVPVQQGRGKKKGPQVRGDF